LLPSQLHACRFLLAFLLAAAWAAAEAAAQIPVDAGALPAELRDEVIAFLNAPETFRIPGGIRIPEGVQITGDVGSLGGSIELAGEVTGRLVVVNGDLRITPSGRVGGEVIIVGGTLVSDPGSELPGLSTVHSLPLRYRHRAGRVEAIPDDAFAPGFLATDLGFGQARFTLRAGPAYNRVEGLPVRFGPLIRTAGSNPLTLEAFGVWKSAAGLNLDSDQLGYAFRVQQAVGGRGTAFLNAASYREVRAIEDRGMANIESSLSTFFLRRDLRDHFEAEGWTLGLDLQPARLPFRVHVGYREEKHTTPLARSPWTLRSSDHPWRPLALVGEGTVRSVEGGVVWDSTDDPIRPSDGWLIAGGISRQVGGDLLLPAFHPTEPPPNDELASPPLPDFSQGMLDIRRYARVGPTSRLNLRVVAAGSLDGSPLPPQLQSALGGEGSLPGHYRFSGDCGARQSRVISRAGTAGTDRDYQVVFPGYGCDRTILFQAEYQGSLPISWNPVPDEWDDSELSGLLDLQPVWSIFFNTGQGWARGDLVEGVTRTDSPTRADVGFGLFLGPVALYWSYPLNRRDRGLNFFVRLQPRL